MWNIYPSATVQFTIIKYEFSNTEQFWNILKGLPFYKTQEQCQSLWAKRFTKFGLPTTTKQTFTRLVFVCNIIWTPISRKCKTNRVTWTLRDPFKKNVSQIFLPTPESFYINTKLKTLEYEALELCFWPYRHWPKFPNLQRKNVLDFSFVYLETLVNDGWVKSKILRLHSGVGRKIWEIYFLNGSP